jgi:hypothetical protein
MIEIEKPNQLEKKMTMTREMMKEILTSKYGLEANYIVADDRVPSGYRCVISGRMVSRKVGEQRKKEQDEIWGWGAPTEVVMVWNYWRHVNYNRQVWERKDTFEQYCDGFGHPAGAAPCCDALCLTKECKNRWPTLRELRR